MEAEMKRMRNLIVMLLALPALGWAQQSTTTTSSTTTTTTTTSTTLPDEEPTTVVPPDAFLAAAAGEVKGERGGFTWAQPGGSIVHADDFGIIPSFDATLVVVEGEKLHLRFASAGVPRSVEVAPIDSASGEPSDELPVAASNPTTFTIERATDVSVLLVSTIWDEGNARHFFRIDVRPKTSPPAKPTIGTVSFTG
jgi:hypothetical protein